MKLSENGINFIKSNEGCKLEAYKNFENEPLTIGYGWTKKVDGKSIEKGMKISQEKAEELFKEGVKEYEKYVNDYVKVPLTQNQYDALVDFVYNLGPNNFKDSTLLKELNNGNYDKASEEFKRWDKVGGKSNSGLLNRREREKNLFLSK